MEYKRISFHIKISLDFYPDNIKTGPEASYLWRESKKKRKEVERARGAYESPSYFLFHDDSILSWSCNLLHINSSSSYICAHELPRRHQLQIKLVAFSLRFFTTTVVVLTSLISYNKLSIANQLSYWVSQSERVYKYFATCRKEELFRVVLHRQQQSRQMMLNFVIQSTPLLLYVVAYHLAS